MSERRQSDYVGRHRKADPPTIPMRVLKFFNESYRVHDDPEHLYSHQPLLHNRKGTKSS